MTEEQLSLRTMESFEAVMMKYKDMLYRLAYSRCGNTHDADDILQDVFLRYMRADKTYNDEEHRKAYLIKMTINCSKSFATSAYNRHRDGTEMSDNETSGRDEIGEAETRSDLMKAVLSLPEKYRTVIYLFYYEDMTVAEIAGYTGGSENAVKTRLSRARSILREKLEGTEPDD